MLRRESVISNRFSVPTPSILRADEWNSYTPPPIPTASPTPPRKQAYPNRLTVKSQTISKNPPHLVTSPLFLASSPSTPSNALLSPHAVKLQPLHPKAEKSGEQIPIKKPKRVMWLGEIEDGRRVRRGRRRASFSWEFERDQSVGKEGWGYR